MASIKSFMVRAYQKLTKKFGSMSYSQTGEDLIVEFFVRAKEIKYFSYLDIGANHPVNLNNTYKFYKSGYSGVCIEPNPHLFNKLKKVRRRDVCLNVGVAATSNSSMDFYVMTNSFLSTFSHEEAISMEKNNYARIVETIKVPLKTVTQVIEEYFGGKAPVFINLDVEGIDEEIIRSFPFDKYRPAIFCIETVHLTPNASSGKRTEIIDLMALNGYKIFADTYVNSIFIDGEKY